MENNKTHFFYVLYSDKTGVFDQSERAYYPFYIIMKYKTAWKIKLNIAIILKQFEQG